MKKCPKCRWLNFDRRDNCSKCGEELPKWRYENEKNKAK